MQLSPLSNALILIIISLVLYSLYNYVSFIRRCSEPKAKSPTRTLGVFLGSGEVFRPKQESPFNRL